VLLRNTGGDSVVKAVRVVVSVDSLVFVLLLGVGRSELSVGAALLHTLVWWRRLQWRQRCLDLHCEILWHPKQLKQSMSRLIMSMCFCLSFTFSQLMGVCDPPQYTQVDRFWCSVFVCHCCWSAFVRKEAVGLGRLLWLLGYSVPISRICISCRMAPCSSFKVHWSLPWALAMFLHVSAESFLRMMGTKTWIHISLGASPMIASFECGPQWNRKTTVTLLTC